MKKLFTLYRLAKDEWDKVIFPTKEQMRNAFISVFIVVSIITFFLALVGIILRAIMSSIL